MNRPRIVSTRACSDPNPDPPRWDEARIVEPVWRLIQQGALRGEGIVDALIAFADLAAVYPEIVACPERHLKLSVEYPA